jgi:hypothetical protein
LKYHGSIFEHQNFASNDLKNIYLNGNFRLLCSHGIIQKMQGYSFFGVSMLNMALFNMIFPRGV